MVEKRWDEMSWAELSKLEFLIKFHQFDNRREFIVVVANNVKRRCRHSAIIDAVVGHASEKQCAEFHCVPKPPSPFQHSLEKSSSENA